MVQVRSMSNTCQGAGRFESGGGLTRLSKNPRFIAVTCLFPLRATFSLPVRVISL